MHCDATPPDVHNGISIILITAGSGGIRKAVSSGGRAAGTARHAGMVHDKHNQTENALRRPALRERLAGPGTGPGRTRTPVPGNCSVLQPQSIPDDERGRDDRLTKEETTKILAVMAEMYPSFRKDRNPEFMAQIWHSVFSSVPYEQIKNALLRFYATDAKGYPPTPGMLREILLEAEEGEPLSGMEAWSMVHKDICRSAYYSGAEFRKLPPVIREVVGSPENLHIWASMDDWQVQSSICPWFLRAYGSRREKDRSHMLLPGGSQLLRIPPETP